MEIEGDKGRLMEIDGRLREIREEIEGDRGR